MKKGSNPPPNIPNKPTPPPAPPRKRSGIIEYHRCGMTHEYKKIEQLLKRWNGKVLCMSIDSPLYSYHSGVELGLGLALGTFQKQTPTWQDQPTEGGYWWLKGGWRETPEFVFIEKLGGHDVKVFSCESVLIKFPKNCKWYGPITPPKEN